MSSSPSTSSSSSSQIIQPQSNKIILQTLRKTMNEKLEELSGCKKIFVHNGEQCRFMVVKINPNIDVAIEFVMDGIINMHFSHLNLKYFNQEKIREDLRPLVSKFVRCEIDGFSSDVRLEVSREIMNSVVMAPGTIDVGDEVTNLMDMVPAMTNVMYKEDKTEKFNVIEDIVEEKEDEDEEDEDMEQDEETLTICAKI